MKKILTLILCLIALSSRSQNYSLKAGDHFPDIVFRPVVNAPVKELDLNRYPEKKIFILNNWGTWCSPCIPEMEMLAKLQLKYPKQIQIVGVSNDSADKLRKYAANKPSKIWLASDTAETLYQMLNLAYVGQSAIIDGNHKILAVVKTDSINAAMIDKLLAGKKVSSNAQVKEKLDNSGKDAFGVDTLMGSSFTIRGYMQGQQTMGRIPNMGVFAKRRISQFNVTLTSLYRTAYDVVSPKQMVYEIDKKKYADYNNKSQLYCFDLLVKPGQKDSLHIIMQQKLQENLPVKARTEMRTMPVYVLKSKSGTALAITETAPDVKHTYSFSGTGYEGKGITLTEFSHVYLSNEMELPVVDETGLQKAYDIKTTNDMRDTKNIIAAVEKLGLVLEKAERPVKVVILYQ